MVEGRLSFIRGVLTRWETRDCVRWSVSCIVERVCVDRKVCLKRVAVPMLLERFLFSRGGHCWAGRTKLPVSCLCCSGVLCTTGGA